MIIRPLEEQINDNLIVKHYAGSHAYGTALPTSDVDFRGIFVADPVHIRTPFFVTREKEDTTEEDTKIYELSAFVQLALDCNPNIIETLWVDKEDIVYSTPEYDYLRSFAPHFLSSKIAFTTTGYATAQLKRVKGHYKWIMNPQPETPPHQVDYITMVHNFTSDKTFKLNLRDFHKGYRLIPFGTNLYGMYSVDKYETFNLESGNLNTTYEGSDEYQNKTPLFIIKFNKQEYDAAKEKWTNYWTWKKNRNKVRAELEEKHEMDTKHVMHLVRLMRMGTEALETGQIIVKRPDAEELLAIRNGAWTYEETIEYAENMDKYIRETLYKTTPLRKKPDVKLAAKVIMDIQDMVWLRRKN